MSDHRTCTSCFPAGSEPSSRIFNHSDGATSSYISLHAMGKSPSMCMQSDHRFRVCHVKQADPLITGLLFGQRRG